MNVDTEPIDAWKGYFGKIKHLYETEGPDNFLTWEPILKAVSVGNAPHIRSKAHILFQSKENARLAKEEWWGHPRPLPDYPFTSGTRVNMLWHLKRLSDFGIDLNQYDTIVEFGGGYGCLCEMIHRKGFQGKYYLYDVPIMVKIQRWYLSHFDFYDLLHGHLISSLDKIEPVGKTAFIGMMSYTETPLSERTQVEERFMEYDLVALAYAQNFIGVNNQAYLGKLAKKLRAHWSKARITESQIDDWRPDKRYFIAERLP